MEANAAAEKISETQEKQVSQAFQVHVDRNVFLKALSHSQGVVEKRSTVPILSHVLLETTGEGITLTATDLEVAIVETVAAQVEKPGRLTVSAHMLFDVVRKLRDGAEISLSFDEAQNRLNVESGRSHFALPCLSPDEFPAINSGNQPYRFILPAKDLLELFDRVRFAMSTEETRYYLNGIYLHAFQSKELRAVATDGHRLAKMSLPLPQGAEAIPGVIISRKTINEVLKIVSEEVLDVEVYLSNTQVSFKFSDTYFTSRLIDGTFPDYEKVIPAHNDKVMTVDMEAFAETVDRVATISSEKNRGIRLSLKTNKLVLTATSNESGHAVEELEVDYNASGIEIGFNSRYLLDIAQQIGNESASFSFADSTSPTIIRSRNDQEALYVLMPMRV
ncbi:DNA polymerase III subunit beta [Candidatus Nucleicultrix amoebiphila]|jgi:DNA polymerase-3 subunit beta|uniref:DNA polymerase III subunit beta n=1 Tax=Candidatus Nucleicultrix amoebiphila TaxID=1509244 RepID=UPI000A269F70|nr:DNA polymerase III subunit beta [Candidatus Nucleicultrix amoebiphila]